MFTNLSARSKRLGARAQLRVEALEDRWAPAHLFAGPGDPRELVLPDAASHGEVGIERASENHRRGLILISH